MTIAFVDTYNICHSCRGEFLLLSNYLQRISGTFLSLSQVFHTYFTHSMMQSQFTLMANFHAELNKIQPRNNTCYQVLLMI